MSKLQDEIKKHALNEVEMRTRIRLANQSKTRMSVFCNRNIWISISVAAAMMFVIAAGAVVYTYSRQNKPSAAAISYAEAQYLEHPLSYALVCVDINPSFEIYIDSDNNTVDIDPINKDAKTLDVASLVGLPIDDAISGIITLAKDAGFINSIDDVDDYVIVSTVLLTKENEDSDKKQDDLDGQIEVGIADDKTLDDNLKVAIIKADQVALFEARGKEIPMGLYVINGMIENDGDMIPVSEFVSNADHLTRLKDGSVIVGNDKKDAPDETTVPDVTSDPTKVNETNPGHSGSQDAADASSSGNTNNTKPDNNKTDNTQPVSTKPDSTKPDSTKPDSTKPDSTKPDSTKPDSTKPDAAKTDNTVPDNANSNANKDLENTSKPTYQDETQAGNIVPDASSAADTKEKIKGASADE